MHCDTINKQLDDYLDGTLAPTTLAEMENHLAACEACGELVACAKKVQDTLHHYASATMPRPATDFYDRALARAAQAGVKTQRTRWVMTGFGGAVAAALMMWVVSGVFLNTPDSDMPHVPSVTMALETPQTFNLVFSSATALNGATMTVTLPDGIEIEGFAGQREISWMTSLKEGRNILPLTLVATAPVGGELLATLQHGDDDKLFRLQVAVI